MEIPITRRTLEQKEAEALAPWAQRSSRSAGRVHNERIHPYRTCYQRDRARVIHCKAFRRLEYKTQVFLNGTGDHLRTRLTHTIEVTSLAQTIAAALGLNGDLAGAIALAHDLGHAPCGHAGESTLDRLMKADGGFEHNRQSLRVVECLESRYPGFPGLNLSWEVLEGLHKRREVRERPAHGEAPAETFAQVSLEAQVADLADEITYHSHDLDDGLECGLIDPARLDGLDVWKVCRDKVRGWFPQLEGEDFLRYVIRVLIDHEVEELVMHSAARIRDAGVASADEARRLPERLVAYPKDLAEMNGQLRAYLYHHLYDHPEVAGPNRLACRKIEEVFDWYRRHPDRLARRLEGSVDPAPTPRRLCDYMAGMTDGYLARQFERLQRDGEI